MAWTEDRVETLKKLWTEGLSASQIAKEMGEGVTRNAIIGKVHRLKLSGRATPSRPPRPRAKPAPKPRITTSTPRTSTTTPVVSRETPVAPPPLEPTPLPSGEFATVLTLTNHICKWPIGDPTDQNFRFCGRKSKANSPYCDAHATQAYQPQSRRRRRGPESATAALDALANARRKSI